MHMLMVIAGGTVLLGVFLLFGKLWGGDTAGLALAAKAFIPAWPGSVDLSPVVALGPVCFQGKARRRGLGGPQARRRNTAMGTNRPEPAGLRP